MFYFLLWEIFGKETEHIIEYASRKVWSLDLIQIHPLDSLGAENSV